MSTFDGRGDSSSSTKIFYAAIGQNPGPSGDTVPASTATTFSIAVGGSVNGYVNTSGDQDWYRVTLTTGHTYTFNLTGSGGLDRYLRLLDSTGVQLGFNDDINYPSNTNSRITFTATWHEVCGLTFTETTGSAEITLDDADSSGAYANWSSSGGYITSATVNVAANWSGVHNGVATWAGVGWASTDWQVAGTGDFNGDGTSDILWRNSTSGDVGQFQMHNGVATWAGVGWAPTDWQTVPLATPV